MAMQFNGQRPNEAVRLVAHQHPVVLLPRLIIAGLFMLIAVAGFAFLNRGIVLSVLVLLGPILGLIYLFCAIYIWKQTLVLVSNERVAYFYQKGLFQREFYECSISSIMQVSHKVEGVVQTVCGYGTVIINTGDAESSIKITGMPDPFDIQQEIQNVLTEPLEK